MGTLDRTLKASLPICAGLLLVLVGLLVFSPAEATLGNLVKYVSIVMVTGLVAFQFARDRARR